MAINVWSILEQESTPAEIERRLANMRKGDEAFIPGYEKPKVAALDARPGQSPAPGESKLGPEAEKIVGRLVQWAGGKKQAAAWYASEAIPAFAGRTAEAMVKDGKAAAVHAYLDHIAAGGFA